MGAHNIPLEQLGREAVSAAEAFEDAMSSVRPTAPEGHIAEEVWERCRHDWQSSPSQTCPDCEGSGWVPTKRIIRPLPTRTLTEQAAEAEVTRCYDLLSKAANTLDKAADYLLQSGRTKEAAQTKAAAATLRAEVGQ